MNEPIKTVLAGEVITPARRLVNQQIEISAGRIGQIAEIDGDQHSAAVVDARDALVIPGLIDVQVNGALGYSFRAEHSAHYDAALRYHLDGGTTTMLPTVITADEVTLIESLRQMARHFAALDVPMTVPGIHLEGPFLTEAKSGAHDPEALCDPDRALFERFFDAADGTIRLLTLAPERVGALELIAHCARAGIVVAAGHSAARFDEMQRAIDAGLRWVTHAGNASDWPHRAPGPLGFMASEPGVVGSLLADQRLGGSVIMDGFHFHPALLKPLLQVKGPERLLLVSDASPVAGSPPGQYDRGGLIVTMHEEGFATSGRGGGWLAGSTIRLLDAVQRAVQLADISLRDAVTMATLGPAQMIGIAAQKGQIVPGADADMLVLNQDLSLRHVISGGTLVKSRAPA